MKNRLLIVTFIFFNLQASQPAKKPNAAALTARQAQTAKFVADRKKASDEALAKRQALVKERNDALAKQKVVADKAKVDALAKSKADRAAKIAAADKAKKDAAKVQVQVKAPAAPVKCCSICGDTHTGDSCFNGSVPTWFAAQFNGSDKNPVTAYEYYSTHGSEK